MGFVDGYNPSSTNMFKFTIGEYSEREGYKESGFVPTYEDKDRDWMLVGDAPWDMFSSSCQKLRIRNDPKLLPYDPLFSRNPFCFW
ncbi:hypothetical protein Bca4012_065915 [Brassica carinata]|uniref:Auxin-responsive protein n=1 Tax=Brassica carinata TaxID=52824 RepID=A0A8X7VPK4_BRACI|nr:hypothetical protein Bca52824_018238 [Brassica carinata]